MGQQNQIQMTQQPTPALSVDDGYLLPLFPTTEAPGQLYLPQCASTSKYMSFYPLYPSFS